MMRRWLPYPRMALAVWLMWIPLAPAFTPGAALTGALVAWMLGFLPVALEHGRRGARKPLSILRLAARVAHDIVRSNLAVAAILARPRPRPRQSGFVRIPLELREPNALATLACIITATPGTIWVSWDPVPGVLVIHVLDLVDETAVVREIRERYEAPLLEIFQ